MKIQINTDHNVQRDESVVRHIEDTVQSMLGRFSAHVTRIEVHLKDANAGKPGQHDKHCLVEARPEGRQPLTTSDDAPTVASAITGAVRKMQHVLESELHRDHKGAPRLAESG